MLIKDAHSRFSKLRVLFIQREFNYWWTACPWSYSGHLGFEEGLMANGVEFVTLTSHWLPWAERICAKRKFDQVWINDIVHLDNVEEKWLEWVSTLAPVRLGFTMESLKYTPEDYAVFPGLKDREQGIETRLKYVTHVATLDENDADELNMRGNAAAIWTPMAIPIRYYSKRNKWNPNKPAVFSGTLYGERKKWLEHPVLKTMLIKQSSPDKETLDPILFDFLYKTVRGFEKFRFPEEISLFFYPVYLYLLRQIRQRSFRRYLRSLQNYCAIVNLPSFFKSYAGRVIEGIAAGCPVISWYVPHRPRTEALFTDGKEILLFDKNDPDQLVRQIMRVKNESSLVYTIIENARQKMLRFHTMEKRVQQILNWIEAGEEPHYV